MLEVWISQEVMNLEVDPPRKLFVAVYEDKKLSS